MKSSSIKVSDIGEKALIERIIAKTRTCSILDYTDSFLDDNLKHDLNSYQTSIGDDSALVDSKIDDNSYLVASSDMLIQSTHFPIGMTYYQMGFKSVTVNISDLIAMGAEAMGFLLNIAIPRDMFLDDFDELICGVVGACDKYKIPLIGGDTNEAGEIIITGVAIAKVEKDKALMKYGFNVGDLVCITDTLGLAALGFELLDGKKQEIASKIDKTLVDMAIFKALKPSPDYENGRILAKYNKDNSISATDITDGLASELYEILNSDKKFNTCKTTNLEESDNSYLKGIRLYEDKLPIENEFKEISKALNLNYLDLFLHIGEDFELLFTINPELEKALKDEMNFYVIGEIIGENTVEMVLSNGDKRKISSKGYQHLK